MSYHSTTDIDENDLQGPRDHLMKKLGSLLRDNALFRFFARHARGQYRPEKHYMRGPGPKAKAKNGSTAAADKSSPKTARPIRQ